MGLEFLRNHGGRRMRDDLAGPLLLDNTSGLRSEDEESMNLDYEASVASWIPRDVKLVSLPDDWQWTPRHFIDGKDQGRTVAWLQTEGYYPVPVRLAEIGAITICNEGGRLKRTHAPVVERVISMVIDPFPWYEIESFAAALQEKDFRLLPCQKPHNQLSYDFQEMRKMTQNRTLDEMIRLEKQELMQVHGEPVLVDGRLAARAGGFNQAQDAVVGMIKEHHRNYLASQKECWGTYYNLDVGQRTPAFYLKQPQVDVISWYLRIDGHDGGMPEGGVVRLEIPARFFEQCLAQDWSYIDGLSFLIWQYRCRDRSYSRASVSIHPIQRAEESLSTLFASIDSIIHRFYRFTEI